MRPNVGCAVVRAHPHVSGCQYIYHLSSKSLGAGTYQVQIVIGTSVVGSGTFGLK